MRTWLLALVASCADPPLVPEAVVSTPPHGNPCVRAGRPCTDMYLVAHEDDDLLFMNPDIARSITAGNRVVIVHVTTGDLPAASVDGFAHQPDPPDFTRYWVDRERGILNAFTAMALGPDAAFAAYAPADAVPTGWTLVTDPGSSSAITVAGVAMAQYDLVAASGQTISAVFMRLSDFQLDQAWNDEPGAGGQMGGVALPGGDTITDGCGDPSPCPLGTAIASQELTREQLIDALAGLVTRFAADSVSAQDATTPIKGPGSGLYWDALDGPQWGSDNPLAEFTDYWDHVYSAAFVMVAATRAQAAMASTVSLRLYRGYTISQEPPDLDDAEAIAKSQVFARYAVFDASIVPHGSPFDVADPKFRGGGDYDLDAVGSWQHRQFATRTLVANGALQGRLAIAGSCVGIAAGAPVLESCGTAPSWVVTATNQLRAEGTSSCLAVAAGGAVALAACGPQTVATTLFLFANGQLRSADAQCLAVAGQGLASVDCDHEPPAPHATGEVLASQAFTLLFERPRVFASELPDATPWLVRRHACARAANAIACAWYADGALGPSPVLAAVAADADDVAVVWDRAAGSLVACERQADRVTCGARTATGYAGDQSLRYVDLTGDGRIDVCARGSSGIVCSLDGGGAWTPAQAWTTRFSDRDGWSDPAYGETVQLADVDGDGLLDACGRSGHGIECAVQLPGAVFGDDASWSFDEDRANDHASFAQDFSDRDPAEPWASSDTYYGTFRLVDVNRDGFADACARGAAGIYCAFSTGTAFERKRLVLPEPLAGGGPLAWGDLDGDPRVDVCGRGSAGLECATGY